MAYNNAQRDVGKKTARAVVAGCDHWRIVGYCDVCVMSVAVVAWCPTVAPNCDEKCRTSTPPPDICP